MGRRKSYQREDVIERAMAVFWERGYAKTSLQDLEQATGLNKKSLYHEFHSKQELFDAAMARYMDMQHQWAISFLGREPLGIQNILDFFDDMDIGPQSKGCLMTMTLNERETVHPEAIKRIAMMLAGMEQALASNLIVDVKDPQTTARLATFLATLIQGVTNMAQLAPPPSYISTIRESVRQILTPFFQSAATATPTVKTTELETKQ